MVIMLRQFVNDTNPAAFTYQTPALQQTLVVAARLVTRDLALPTDYQTDLVNVTITPDPSTLTNSDGTPCPDYDFMDLTATKAAGIIDRGAAFAAASQAIRVQDGASQVDLRAVFDAKAKLLKQGWNAVYEEMRERYMLGQRAVPPMAAVTGPRRLFRWFGGGDWYDGGRGAPGVY